MATQMKTEKLKADVKILAADVEAKAKTAAKSAYAKGSAIVADVETKAKAAYAKGSAVVEEVGEISKQNIEAVASSAEIFGKGIKTIGEDMIGDSRSALVTLGDDVKTFADVKSPSEVFKLQGDLAARNFDALVLFGAKNGKAMRDLASEMMAPLAGRVKANYQTLRGAF